MFKEIRINWTSVQNFTDFETAFFSNCDTVIPMAS